MGRQAVRITADTNVLVRAIMQDDSQQSPVAQKSLAEAETVALALPALCELVWVLSQSYKLRHDRIAAMMCHLLGAANIVVDRPAAEAGLLLLERGGDFADGAIAHAGKWLGGEEFVSFDREAVRLLHAQGDAARVLS